MIMDNGEGIEGGREEWAGRREAKGKKSWNNCNRIKNKKKERYRLQLQISTGDVMYTMMTVANTAVWYI